MSISSRLPALLFAMAATTAIMVIAAMLGAKFTSLGAALGFALIAGNSALALNQGYLGNPSGALIVNPDAPLRASRTNARLMALIYGWGALAIFAIYALTELWWFHSWQYASAMGLIAALLMGFAYLLNDPASQFRSPIALDVSALLAVAQATGAAMGIFFLINSGKLASIKSDWPANHVFVGGGLAIIVVSIVSALTHLRLKRAAIAGGP